MAVRAVVFNEFGGVPVVTEVPEPSPPPGGVVLRVEAIRSSAATALKRP